VSEEKPSPVTYHEYDIPRTNRVFAWSSVLLLGVSLWMIWADYSREWKGFARRFREVEIARTRTQGDRAAKTVDQKALAAVNARLAEGEKAEASRAQDLDRLRRETDQLEGKWYAADQGYKFIKAELDVARYEIDEAHHKNEGVAHAEEKFTRARAETEKRRLAFEEVDRKKQGLDAEIAALTRDASSAKKDRDKLYAERDRLAGRLEKLGHSGAIGIANDYFRDLPLVDFLAPQYKVQQVILPQVHEDVNFLTVPRVDRCHTCHAAADKPGYADTKEAPLAAEFRSHPRLDLLLGRNHPVERFGCTSCHAGSGRAITFVDTAHAPRDEKQATEWEDKRDWHPLHHWDFPMLPVKYAEAGCINCHGQETRIPGADKLNAGRELIEQYGCWGCHKIDRAGWDELRKVGPDLGHIQGKVTREWMYKWVKDPKSFRPSTRMPRFWGNSNTAQAVPAMNYPLRDDVEAEAVVNYLLARSKPYGPLARPAAGTTGDATRGKWVVDNRGCKACHVVGASDKGEGRHGAHFGPELNQVGSKLTPAWLYAWIKDPKSVWPDTKMPSLRLSDQEAADAAAYLATLKNPEFEARPLPDVTGAPAQQMLETVTYEYLRKEMRTDEARARLAAMDPAARYEYLGGKLISRYGCFGCHAGVPGYENAQRIGTELTTWASKLMTQLDFGLVHLPHTKHDWLKNKLMNPRIYDEGKVETKDPQDLFKMPNFQLTEAETDLIMTVVLGFQRDLVQLDGHRQLDFARTTMENGRRIARAANCQGCHVVENKGGGMETVVEGGKPFAPPVLIADFKTLDGRSGKTEQGAKTEPAWLFQFLKEPTPIRPWLNLRMPSFGLSDAQATGIIQYFATHAGVPFPYDSFDPATLPDDRVAEGLQHFTKFQCVSCHLPLDEAKKLGVTVDQLAPNLELAKHRLRYEWLKPWLLDPGAIQKDTKMPSYFYGWDEDARKYIEAMPEPDRKIDAIRAYLQFHGARSEGKVAAARK
jgi:cbb3-type cytochrome oxidase cytochrome c subunit